MSNRAACDDCGWPRVPTPRTGDDPLPHRPTQFTLRSILISVTVVCIGFAVIGRYGINGLFELTDAAFLLVIPILLMVEVYYRWIKDDMEGT